MTKKVANFNKKKLSSQIFKKFFKDQTLKIFSVTKKDFFKTFFENQKVDIPKMSIFQNPWDFLKQKFEKFFKPFFKIYI